MRWLLLLVLVAAGAGQPAPARAQTQGPCRTVEVGFSPVKNLQIAVWVEDTAGNYVATLYVTRLTGSFGLANRPGNHFLHAATRFPYGRRDMVLPIWAHKRNKSYGYVVMGGKAGNDPSNCTAFDGTGSCDDNTIAFHAGVSSPEPFYCSPSGGQITQNSQGVDVVSCASPFYGSKGAYATDGRMSLYPPRADLTSFNMYDSDEAHQFASLNDLGAVSGATPQLQRLLDPPIRWRPFNDGKYVVRVEVALESDTNPFHNYHYNVDSQQQFNSYGHDFIGQPSVVYSLPITVGDGNDEATTSSYDGYSDFDGATGTMHLPDMTITDSPGTGAGRLLDATDGGKTFRLRVRALPSCDTGGCAAPEAPVNLTLTPKATSVDVSFASAPGGIPANRFDIRYRDTPISDADFTSANPSDMTPPSPGTQGSVVTTSISGLHAEKSYYVAVRAFSTCDAPSPAAISSTVTTQQKFVVLHGCFIATAAYGTPLASEIDALRTVRDRALLTNPLGRLAVAGYYALSPPVAAAIATDERLRAGARALIGPIVDVARAGLRAAAAAR
ncbi:MAG: Fibronectin type domain protein [Myxococcales bacterium]|nr:Fibronectin type domain protein [Myxococcales bacterium]